jgi:uncharacterized caspase-like protein
MTFLWLRIGLLLCLGLFNAQTATAQNDHYLEERPPKRLALVVGNSDYANTTKLPGARVDADRMDEILRGLGFTVTKVKDVQTRAEFLTVHFLPFVAAVGEGDIAVLYFSGHGFTYAGENYLAPLQFPRSIKSGEVFTTFISSSSLHILMNDRHPSFVLMLLDACRNIGDFLDNSDPTAKNLIAKGLAEARIAAENTVIGFSSDAGAISLGSAGADLSIYTEALAEHLPSPAKDLDDIRKEVRFSVRFKTENKQVPWFSDSSSAEVYFSPSAQILQGEKEAWIATLGEGTVRAVSRFLSRHGTGPYGAAARRWLVENRDAPAVRTSAVSPAAPEAAWTARPGAGIALPRIEGAIAPRASVAIARGPAPAGVPPAMDVAAAPAPSSPAAEGRTAARGLRSVAAETRAIDEVRVTDPARASAEALVRLGEGVVTSPVEGRTQPRADAPISRQLQAGTRVAVEGIEVDAQKNTWLRARTLDGRQFYVMQLRPDSPSGPIEIGEPLAEVNLSGRSSGLKSLVDEAPLVKVIEDLKGGGKDITWVSIATPKAEAKGQDELYGLRAVHVRSVLAAKGVSRERITTVEGVPLASGDLRIRVFGR